VIKFPFYESEMHIGQSLGGFGETGVGTQGCMKEGALQLEPHLQATFTLVILEMVSHKLLPGLASN
jgi:hypothetical protein